MIHQIIIDERFIAVPSLEKFTGIEDDLFPGELILKSGNIVLNLGRHAVKLKVVNKADRPVQVI
jgi:urease subunit gamma/beta